MSQLPLIFVFMLVLLGLTWGQWLYQKKLKKDLIEQILSLITSLKKLIGLSQKHRGLNATLLQGNQTVSADIESLRVTISQVIESIKLFSVIKTEARWDGYLDHWQRLQKNSASLSVAQSFEQHTVLVETLLYLLEDVAQRLELEDKNENMIRYYYLWQSFPHVVEYIGQARAIGVAVATKAVSTQVDKVKLGYLCDKISNMTTLVFTQLNEHKTGTTTEQIEHCRQRCTSLVNTIQASLINQDTVTLDSQTYFELASDTMDKCNQLLEQELEQVKQLNSR